MANKNLKYTVEADTKAFQEGMEQAVYATDKTEKAIQQLINDTPSLKKMFLTSKREAEKLAAAFAMLSDEEKKSRPGQQLAADLREAMEKAAELQDVLNDTSTGIRNLSGDQQALDALAEGFSTIGSAASAVLGTIATATGKQEDFNRAVAAFTTVQSVGNTVVKVKNMLQKESNVMLAIGRVQTAALAKAQDLQTAATGKATIAQKLFNAVAKANPYVLLATAVIAVGTALAAFVIHSSKAAKAQKEQAEATKLEQDALDAYKNSLTSSLGEAMTSYKSLQEQWKNCNTELSKTEFIKKHQTEFKKLGVEVKTTTDAENVFEKNTEAVKEGLMKRAKAAAKAAQAQVYYGQAIAKTIELESLQSRKLQELAEAKDETRVVGTSTAGTVMTVKITAAEKRAEIEKKYIEEEKKRQAEIEDLNRKGDKLIGEAVDEGYGADTGGSSGGSSGGSKKTKEQITRLQELENKAKDVQKQLENLNEKAPDFNIKKEDLTKKLKDAEQAVKDYKIAIGIETPKSEVDQHIDDLKAQLKKHEEDFKVAVMNNDEAAKQAAIDAYKTCKEEIEKYTIKIPVEPDINKLKEKLAKILEESKPKKEYDFSIGLSEEDKEKAEKSLQDLRSLEEETKNLQDLLAETKGTPLFDEISEKIAKNKEEIKDLEDTVEDYNDQAKGNKKESKEWDKKSKNASEYANMLGTVGDAFKSLGDSQEAQAAQFAVNTAATIAQTVSTIAAMNAKALAEGSASAFALPFPACLGAWATIFSTIVSIFSSLPSFASGGVIPGGTSLRDNQLAHVASGEMILNQRQQNNLFNAIDKNMIGSGTNRVEVTGVIKGKDLLLVQKNYNSIGSKSGQSIHIS